MGASLKESLGNFINQSYSDVPTLISLNPATEPEITVDMNKRKISVPSELQIIGVATENNAETIYIRIPSTTFDGTDLTDKTAYIYYVNAGNEFNIIRLSDVLIEDNSIKLGWTITNDVTRFAGTVSFILSFELNDSYKWSTTPATLTVLSGLDINQTISKEDTAIVSALYDKVNTLEKKIENTTSNIDNSIGTINSLYKTIKSLQSEVNYLKEHVVYIVEDTE